MKTQTVLLGIALLGLSLAVPDDLRAAGYGSRRNNNQPNPPPAPEVPERRAPAKPAKDKQEKFKALPLNTVFFLTTDGYKSDPRVKLTATTARNIKEGVTNKVSPEMVVTIKGEPAAKSQP